MYVCLWRSVVLKSVANCVALNPLLSIEICLSISYFINFPFLNRTRTLHSTSHQQQHQMKQQLPSLVSETT